MAESRHSFKRSILPPPAIQKDKFGQTKVQNGSGEEIETNIPIDIIHDEDTGLITANPSIMNSIPNILDYWDQQLPADHPQKLEIQKLLAEEKLFNTISDIEIEEKQDKISEQIDDNSTEAVIKRIKNIEEDEEQPKIIKIASVSTEPIQTKSKFNHLQKQHQLEDITKKCISCEEDIKIDAKFCHECGSKQLSLNCLCGYVYNLNDKFCSECGKKR